MAKSRAQRKAERRKREESGIPPRQDRAIDDPEGSAQQDTQLGVSGDVREVEAAEAAGAMEAPPSPAPSRADVGRPDQAEESTAPTPAETRSDESTDDARARKEREKEQRRKARTKQLQKGGPAAADIAEPRKRGRVTGFLASSAAELRRVQWPDRDTLIQASAVTLIFVVVMATFLGGLDALFNFLIKQIL